MRIWERTNSIRPKGSPRGGYHAGNEHGGFSGSGIRTHKMGRQALGQQTLQPCGNSETDVRTGKLRHSRGRTKAEGPCGKRSLVSHGRMIQSRSVPATVMCQEGLGAPDLGTKQASDRLSDSY